MPRDHWLVDWEKEAIRQFAVDHPLEGYRRLTFMMLDTDTVAVSPSSVYRVLKQAGLLNRWNRKHSKKGTGFKQPEKPHQHWHIDIAYINICGTFVYLCTVLDGCSRAIVHHELHTAMPEHQVELILQRAKEKFPAANPRVISDNGPQFIAGDFKRFIRLAGMTHVRTSPYYPQSNGKIERWHKTLKSESIRVKTPLTIEDARRIVRDFVVYYNTTRLHSAIGYITPIDRLEERQNTIFAQRDRKLAQAREARRKKRVRAHERPANPPPNNPTISLPPEGHESDSR
jgi:transposase InsO family protein